MTSTNPMDSGYPWTTEKNTSIYWPPNKVLQTIQTPGLGTDNGLKSTDWLGHTPYLEQCFANEECDGVQHWWPQSTGNEVYLIKNLGYKGTSTESSTQMFKTSRNQVCNTPKLVEPYLSMCLSRCASKPGTCDQMMIPYCLTTKGKSDPLCACINSKVTNAACNDNACINGGYMTTNMVNLLTNGCPAPPPTATSYTAPSYSTAPSTYTSTPSTSTGTSAPPQTMAPAPAPTYQPKVPLIGATPTTSSNTWIYIAIGVVVLLLLCGIGIFFYMRKGKVPKK